METQNSHEIFDDREPFSIGYTISVCALAVIGVVGNILILVIFQCKEWRESSYSVYIRAAAISDTMVILMNTTEDIIDDLSSYSLDRFLGSSLELCQFWNILSAASMTSSPWIVVALALDRCIAVWKPYKSGFCSKRVACFVTFVIVSGSLSTNFIILYPAMSITYLEEAAKCSVYGTHNLKITIGLLLATALPCFTMLLPNVLVVFKIQQSLRFRQAISSVEDQNIKVARSARPLIMVLCLSFLTLLPISIIEMVELVNYHQYSEPEINNHTLTGSAQICNQTFAVLFMKKCGGNSCNARNIKGNFSFFNCENITFGNNSEDQLSRLLNEVLDNADLKESTDMEINETSFFFDIVWKALNFIYMVNFAQNFYILVISSQKYRKMVSNKLRCKIVSLPV